MAELDKRIAIELKAEASKLQAQLDEIKEALAEYEEEGYEEMPPPENELYAVIEEGILVLPDEGDSWSAYLGSRLWIRNGYFETIKEDLYGAQDITKEEAEGKITEAGYRFAGEWFEDIGGYWTRKVTA